MYIPTDWLVNPNNIEEIHRLASELLYSDVVFVGVNDNSVAVFEEKLLEMGETILVEKIRDGKLMLVQA